MTTIHTRQLQKYTRPINNNYTQDNLKLTKIHARQIVNSYYPSGSLLCTNNLIEGLFDEVITRDRICLSWDFGDLVTSFLKQFVDGLSPGSQ